MIRDVVPSVPSTERYFVATTCHNIPPAAVVELLTKMAKERSKWRKSLKLDVWYRVINIFNINNFIVFNCIMFIQTSFHKWKLLRVSFEL